MAVKDLFNKNFALRAISTGILAPLVIFILTLGEVAISLMGFFLVLLLWWEWINLIKNDKKPVYYIFGFFYILLPVICAVYIVSHSCDHYYLLKITGLVWASDIGAYLSGRIFGGAKINPKISPNKTWSGYYGGLFLTSLLGYFLGFEVVFALLISILAQIGDLLESMIKRKFNAVNSGNLIPGHGGVLDRFDSFVLVLIYIAAADFLYGLCYA